jgi:hypothetical protein
MRLLSAFLASLALFGCAPAGVDPNASVPAPSTLRTDLQFGYYASVPTVKGDDTGQIQETREHVNVYMDMLFGGEQFTIDSILYMKKPTILGVQYWMYDERNRAKVDGEAQLIAYLGRLQAAGALQYVTDAYPLDEPDLLGTPESEIQAVNAAVRRAFALYGMYPRLSVIYGVGFTWNGVRWYDDIGFDNYSAGSGIFYNGDIAKLKAVANKPGQKIWLVPGGASPWRQDPTQFINYAHSDPQVRGLINFVYFDSTHPSQLYGKGIRTNGTRSAYCAAGAKLIGVSVPC